MSIACWGAWVLLAIGCARFGWWLMIKLME
jgi:hypothetical protein